MVTIRMIISRINTSNDDEDVNYDYAEEILSLSMSSSFLSETNIDLAQVMVADNNTSPTVHR